MKKTKGTRKGKHKPGQVRMGLYVDPFKKAIAVYLADLKDMTLSEVIWRGIETLAIGAGIISPDGKVLPKHKMPLEVIEKIVKESEVNG